MNQIYDLAGRYNFSVDISVPEEKIAELLYYSNTWQKLSSEEKQEVASLLDLKTLLKKLIDSELERLYGGTQTERRRAYLKTQSLMKILKVVPKESIVTIEAGRETLLQSVKLPVPYRIKDYFNLYSLENLQGIINYNQRDHGFLDVEELKESISNSDLRDIAVDSMTLKFSSSDLRDHLREIFNAIQEGFGDYLTSTFYAFLKSRTVIKKDEEEVRRVHEDYYFLPAHLVKEKEKGIGWIPRSLDLEALYSDPAIRTNPVVGYRNIRVKGELTKIKVRAFDLEEATLSGTIGESSLLNSKLVTGHWKSSLPPELRELVGWKKYVYSSEGKWVYTGE